MKLINNVNIISFFIFSLLIAENDISSSRENAITYAIEKVSNSIVGINVTQIKQQSFDPFFDFLC